MSLQRVGPRLGHQSVLRDSHERTVCSPGVAAAAVCNGQAVVGLPDQHWLPVEKSLQHPPRRHPGLAMSMRIAAYWDGSEKVGRGRRS